MFKVLPSNPSRYGLDVKTITAAQEIYKGFSVPAFTPDERRILNRYFSNADDPTFFIIALPETFVTALMARNSRIKNKRGIRGIFLEEFITAMPIVGSLLMEPERFAEERDHIDLSSLDLDGFVAKMDEWIGNGVDAEKYRQQVDGKKVREWLKNYLDSYGHNSIARMGIAHFVCEHVSCLTAKDLEWARPGAGYIELSTRYVDMSNRGESLYPIWKLFPEDVRQGVQSVAEAEFDLYAEWIPKIQAYHAELFARYVPDKGMLLGKAGDTLGNLLPCGTMTSVTVSVMGESFSSVLKHLFLSGNPESYVLAQRILDEAEKLGFDVLLNYVEPSAWELGLEGGFRPAGTRRNRYGIEITYKEVPGNHFVRHAAEDFHNGTESVFAKMKKLKRDEHDKLPACFETSVASFRACMSMRTWRDWQRMGFCSHRRGLVTPHVGLFIPPDIPNSLLGHYNAKGDAALKLYEKIVSARPELSVISQYFLMMGNMVEMTISANLREWEFALWQRSKFSAHFEARWFALAVDKALSANFPEWPELLATRMDRTPDYLFARTPKDVKPIPRP